MITDQCTNVRITDVQMKNLLLHDTHLHICTSVIRISKTSLPSFFLRQTSHRAAWRLVKSPYPWQRRACLF